MKKNKKEQQEDREYKKYLRELDRIKPRPEYLEYARAKIREVREIASKGTYSLEDLKKIGKLYEDAASWLEQSGFRRSYKKRIEVFYKVHRNINDFLYRSYKLIIETEKDQLRRNLRKGDHKERCSAADRLYTLYSQAGISAGNSGHLSAGRSLCGMATPYLEKSIDLEKGIA